MAETSNKTMQAIAAAVGPVEIARVYPLPSASEPVDYRDLLRKYMQHVRKQKGTTCMIAVMTPDEWLACLGDAADDIDRAEAEQAACGFTDAEIAVLREIEKATTR